MVGPRITVINIICPRPLALCNYSRWFNLSHKLWCTTARGYLSGWSCRQENQTETLPHPAVRALPQHTRMQCVHADHNRLHTVASRTPATGTTRTHNASNCCMVLLHASGSWA